MVSPSNENMSRGFNLRSHFTVFSGRCWLACISLTMLLSIIGWSALLLLAIWQTIEPKPMDWVLYIIIGIALWLMVHAIVTSCIVIQTQIDINGFIRHSDVYLQHRLQTLTMSYNNLTEQVTSTLHQPTQATNVFGTQNIPATQNQNPAYSRWCRDQTFASKGFSEAVELDMLRSRRSLSPETNYSRFTGQPDAKSCETLKTSSLKTNREGVSESCLNHLSTFNGNTIPKFQMLAGSTDSKPAHKSLETQANFLDSEDMHRYPSLDRGFCEDQKLSRRAIMCNFGLSHPEAVTKRTPSTISVPQRPTTYGSSEFSNGSKGRQFSSYQNLKSSASHPQDMASRNSSQINVRDSGLPNLVVSTLDSKAGPTKPSIQPKPVIQRSSSPKRFETVLETGQILCNAIQKHPSIESNASFPGHFKSCENLDGSATQTTKSSGPKCHSSNFCEPSKDRFPSTSSVKSSESGKIPSQDLKSRSSKIIPTRKSSAELLEQSQTTISKSTTSRKQSSQSSSHQSLASEDAMTGLNAPQNSPNSQNSLSFDDQNSGFRRSTSYQALPSKQWLKAWSNSIDKIANAKDSTVIGVRV